MSTTMGWTKVHVDTGSGEVLVSHFRYFKILCEWHTYILLSPRWSASTYTWHRLVCKRVNEGVLCVVSLGGSFSLEGGNRRKAHYRYFHCGCNVIIFTWHYFDCPKWRSSSLKTLNCRWWRLQIILWGASASLCPSIVHCRLNLLQFVQRSELLMFIVQMIHSHLL